MQACDTLDHRQKEGVPVALGTTGATELLFQVTMGDHLVPPAAGPGGRPGAGQSLLQQGPLHSPTPCSTAHESSPGDQCDGQGGATWIPTCAQVRRGWRSGDLREKMWV